MNIKQKVRIKLQQIIIDIFLNQTLCELADCLFWFIKIKVTVQDKSRLKARRYYFTKGIINNYNVIINGKNFHD